MTDIPMKNCNGCSQSLPATPEFFRRDSSKRDHLYTLCRYCTSPEGREKRLQAKISNTLPDGYARCTKCQQIKPATSEYFDFRNVKRGKLFSECKPCKAERWQNYLEKNPLYWHNWYQSRAEQVKKSTKEYYQEHTEDRLTYRRAYYVEHQEECKTKAREYKRANRETYTTLQNKRRALKNASNGTLTSEDIQDQYKRQKGRCYYYSTQLGKKRKDYHADHIKPLSRGGSNSPDNIVIACPSCNISKHDKFLHEWPQGQRLI